MFPLLLYKPPFKYGASLIPFALSLVVRLTVTPPCLNKGNLLPLRSSLLLFCLGPNYTLHLVTQMVENLPALQPDQSSAPGFRFPGEGNGKSLNTLAWRIPWTEEPAGLQSMRSQRVEHDWATTERLLLNHQRCHDSWPPEEKNSIWDQWWGLMAQRFCVIKFY